MKKSLSDLGVEVVMYENYMDLLVQIEVAVVASRPDLNAPITVECLKRDIYVFSGNRWHHGTEFHFRPE